MKNPKNKKDDLVLMFLLAIYFAFMSVILIASTVINILDMNVTSILNWAYIIMNLILVTICIYCLIRTIQIIISDFKQNKNKGNNCKNE